MKVLINAVSARIGGGQTYLLNLLNFLGLGADCEIIILATDSLKLELNDNPNIKRAPVPKQTENPLFRLLWERYCLPKLLKELKIDILFCPGGVIGTVPTAECKTVTMFRNMIPFDLEQRAKYPLGYMRVRNWLLQKEMMKSMLRADLVIFISQYAKSVIEGMAKGGLKHTVVIPHGINDYFRISERNNLVKPDWLPEEYLLYVSTIDVYKSQIELVQGFAMLKKRRETKEKLILAGPQYHQYAKKLRSIISNLGLDKDVILTGSIPYDQLPHVYHHAKINIFASQCENCPNILLEALGAGRPLLVSNYPPMPEFGGDSVVYFDPSSPSDFVDKIMAIIDNPDYMRELSLKAVKESANYRWEDTALRTWDAMERICKSKRL